MKRIFTLCLVIFLALVVTNSFAQQEPRGDFSLGDVDYSFVNEIPGKIQAENYDLGGEGVAYHNDGTGGKLFHEGDALGLEPAQDDADDEDWDGEESLNVGWTASGEWYEYTLENLTHGIYDIHLRYAVAGEIDAAVDRTVTFSMGDGEDFDELGVLECPNTGDWHFYVNLTLEEIEIDPIYDPNVLRIDLFISTGPMINLNWVDFELLEDLTVGKENIKSNNIEVYPNPVQNILNVKNLENVQSVSLYRVDGTEIETVNNPNSELEFNTQNLKSGVYLVVVNSNNGSSKTIKVVK